MDNVSTTISLSENITGPLKNAVRALSSVSEEFEDLANLAGNIDSGNLSLMSKTVQKLDRNMGSLSGETEKVTQAQSRQNKAMESGESSARGAADSLDDLEGEAEQVGSAMLELMSNVASAQNSFDSVDTSGLTDQLESLNNAVNLGNFMSVAGIAQQAAGALMGIGGAAMESAAQVESSVSSIKMGLGATEEQAQSLESVARDVFRNNFGESLDDVTQKLTYMKQLLGDSISDAELGPLLSQYISLDDAGMDFNETLRGANNLVKGFGISWQQATDLMTAGMQRGLNFSDELGDNIAEYAPRWGELGISASRYFSILEAGSKSGAYQLDKVGDFLNEFLTSMNDGRMDEGLNMMSKGAVDVYVAWQENKASVEDVFETIIGELASMDQLDQAVIASTMWGSLGEDNAMAMIDALAGVEDSYADVSGAGQELADNNTNAAEQLTRTWEDMKLTLGEAASTLSGPLSTALGGVNDAIKWMSEHGPESAAAIAAIGGAIGGLAISSSIPGDLASFTGAISSIGETLANSKIVVALTSLLNPVSLAVAAFGALGAATIALMANGKTLLDVAAGFSEFNSAIDNFAAGFQEKIAGVVSGIQENLPALAAEAGEIMPELLRGILNTGINLAGKGAEIVVQLVAGIAQALPTIIESGIEFVSNFLSGIMEAAPDVASNLLDMVIGLGQTIAENLPTIIQAGADAILAFSKGLTEHLPELLAKGWEMVSGLIQTIADHLPDIISTGFDLLSNFVTGILQALPTLAQAATQLIVGFGGYLIENLPTILQSGLELVGGLVMGLVNAIPSLLVGVAKLLSAIMDGIAQAVPNIITAAWDLAVNLVSGLSDGIANAWGGFWSFLTEKFQGIIDWVRGLFGCHSPSTVFSDIGTNLIEGFLGGLKSVWENVTGWFSDAWNGLKDMVSGFFGNLFGGEETDQPEVDYTETITNVTGQLDQLEGLVQERYERLIEMSSILGGSMAGSVAAGFGSMTGQVLDILNLLGESVTGKMDEVRGSLAGIFDGVNASAMESLSTLGENTGALIMDIVINAAEGISGLIPIFTDVFGALAKQTAGEFGAIRDNASSSFNDLVASAEESINELRSYTAGQASALTREFTGQVSVMATTAKSVFVSMTSSMLTSMNTLSSGISAKMAGFKESFVRQWQEIRSSTRQSFNALVNDLNSAMDKLLKSLSNKIGSLGPTFRAAGVDMMNELRDGINSRMNDVTSTASTLVQQLKETFESGLGIHSPSDFMIWIGQMLMEGLIKGMSGSQLQSFIEGVIGDMQNSFENGKFNANELVNFLDDDATLNLIGRVANVDTSNVNSSQITYPLIGTKGTQTSFFGPRPYPGAGGSTNHGGVDLATDMGTPIAAALGGTVTTAAMSDGYGNLVVIDHGGGVETYYGHMSAIQTQAGATVSQGQQIGLVGSTGNSTGPHLHFEIRQNGTKIDPQPYIEGAAGITAGNSLQSAIQTAYNLKKGIGLQTMSGAAGNIAYDISAGAEQWRPVVLQALSMIGQPASLANEVLATLNKESSGNPNAINDWDINARNGTPSKGLMQVIDPTFKQYAVPGYDTNIWDPLSNILASLKYQLARYKSIYAHLNGYATGTDSAVPGYHWVGENGPELMKFRGGEQVIPNRESLRMVSELPTLPAGANVPEPMDGYARGTGSATPGIHWVGEEGPELLGLDAIAGKRLPTPPAVSISETLKSFESFAGMNAPETALAVEAFIDPDALVSPALKIDSGGGSVFNSDQSTSNYAGATSAYYTSPGDYIPANGGSTYNYVTNAPITLNSSPTINNREEFRVSDAEIERELLKALRRTRSEIGELA